MDRLVGRLAFVVLGVLTLVVLSEISKLNLHQYLKRTRVPEKIDGQISVPYSADVAKGWSWERAPELASFDAVR